MLRPDDPNYDFNSFFEYDYSNHIVNINPKASENEQEKARFTIDVFKFNDAQLCEMRRASFQTWLSENRPENINDFNYRFILQ